MLAAAIFFLILGFAYIASSQPPSTQVDDNDDHDYESYRRQMKRERFRDDFKFGLIDNTNLTVFPLVTVNFTGDIHDSLFSNTISMTFQNPHEEAFSDISFVFPIDPNAAIYDLHIKIGDREVLCAVEEKEKATNDYEEAKKQGHGVYRGNIDATQRDVYQIDFGNLPPGESALITLRYVTQLNLESMSSYRLSIPVGIFERYAPVGFKDKNPIQSVQIGASSVKHYSASSFPINIALYLHLTYNTISSINSPSKSPFELEMIGSISSDKKNKLNTFGIKSVLTSAIGDYVLILNFKEELKSSLFLQDVDDASKNGKSSSVSMVSLMPTLWKNFKFSEDQAIEIFFVIDQSGSMSGDNIELARKTLSLSINGLPERSSFNIVGFGDTYTPYFKELREFNDASKRDALEILRSLDANMGGTEILSPLEHIIEAYSRSKRPRYVFLITDGAVSNQNEVVELVQRDNFQFATKYFTFGIGRGASRGLIEDTAKASGGAFEMIDDIDISSGKVGDKVLRQLTRVVDPALSNARVHWKFSDVDVPVSRNHASIILQQSPAVIPAVLKDSRQNIFVEINKNASQVRDTLESSFFEGALPSYLESDAVNANVKAGIESNTELNYKEILDNTYLASSASLKALAGKSFLRELEIKYDLATTQEEKSDIKSKAIEMSKNSGIISRFTSFIAIELRPQVDPLETTEIRQSTYSRIYLSDASPTAVPAYPASFRRNSAIGSQIKDGSVFGSVRGFAGMKAAAEYSVESVVARIFQPDGASSVVYEEENLMFAAEATFTKVEAEAAAEAEAELKRMRDPVSILSRILMGQSTDGSWQNIHEECIDEILASGSTDEFFSSAPSDIDSVVLATIANHICIEQKFANMRSTFELALRKSVRFISLKTGWFFANGKVDVVSHLPERVGNLFNKNTS